MWLFDMPTFCDYFDNIHLEKHVKNMFNIYFHLQRQVLIQP